MLKVGMPCLFVSVLVGGLEAARAQTPIPPSPKDFVLAATQSNQYEILAATIAIVRSQNARVRAFAEEMIRDHKRLDVAMRDVAIKSGLPAPNSGISSDQAMLLSGLQSASEANFDLTFAGQQVLAHAQVAAVVDSFADAGSEASLRKEAQAALPVIEEHFKMAKQLNLDVGGS